jgi:hypothetical protein
MRRTLTLLVVLGCLALVPHAAAAEPVSGTVTVENGTANGAPVTVVPVTERLERAGEPVTTTVTDGSFSVEAGDAPRHAVRVEYEGATHHELLGNRSSVDVHLSETVRARVVDADGTPRPGVSVELVDGDGFAVTSATTDENGTVAFGPVEADETYDLRATVEGAPYRRSVDPTANRTATLRTRPPTTDASVLSVANDTQTGYVIQLVPPRNDSGVPSVVQTVTLRNAGDRPFVGHVVLHTPTGASPYAAMARNRETTFSETDEGVRLNVTLPAGGTTQVGAAYDLAGSTFEMELGRDAPSLTVVLQGYDPTAVEHSATLRVGDAPIALLTSDGSLAAGDRIRIDLEGARTAAASPDGGSADATNQSAAARQSESNSIPAFPGVPILGGVGAAVVLGLAAYRIAPEDASDG